jgi:hypothetical protein
MICFLFVRYACAVGNVPEGTSQKLNPNSKGMAIPFSESVDKSKQKKCARIWELCFPRL